MSTTDAPHHHLRHHAPRRRAIARLQHEPRRKARGRPGAGRSGRRRHRGRLSHRVAGRLRSGAADRRRRCAAPRSAAWPAATTRTSTALGSARRTRPTRGSTSSSPPARSIASSSCEMGKDEIVERAVAGVKRARELLRQHRVLARRRRPHRARLPLPSRRSGHRRRRHDGQHSRHGRLRDAGRTTAASSAISSSACRTSTRR